MHVINYLAHPDIGKLNSDAFVMAAQTFVMITGGSDKEEKMSLSSHGRRFKKKRSQIKSNVGA